MNRTALIKSMKHNVLQVLLELFHRSSGYISVINGTVGFNVLTFLLEEPEDEEEKEALKKLLSIVKVIDDAEEIDVTTTKPMRDTLEKVLKELPMDKAEERYVQELKEEIPNLSSNLNTMIDIVEELESMNSYASVILPIDLLLSLKSNLETISKVNFYPIRTLPYSYKFIIDFSTR